MIEGATARPRPDGSVVITQAKLQTFLRTGATQFKASTPECLYDAKQRTLASSTNVTLQTADEKFVITGTGFSLSETNRILFISNQVHTTIHPALLDAAAQTPDKPSAGRELQIVSDRFSHNLDAGLALYEGQVAVTGTNLLLRGGRLAVEIPTGTPAQVTASGIMNLEMTERLTNAQVKVITVDQDVSLNYADIRASGDHALYTVASETLRVWGNPKWATPDRAGHADEITIDRSNKVFLAEGNAFLRLSGADLRGVGLLGLADDTADGLQSETNRMIEIRSARYEIRTNSASFSDNVRVIQEPDSESPMKLTCARLELGFAGTNELRRIDAQGLVAIEQGDQALTGQRAAYENETKLLTIDGNPSWRAGGRSGAGDVIRVDVEETMMAVVGNAWMEMPAKELADNSVLGAPPDNITRPTAEDAQMARVYASEYQIGKTSVWFSGTVRIDHPQMQWSCEQLLVELPPDDGPVRRIVAEPQVTFSLLDRQGRSLSGAGNRAVYSHVVNASQTNAVIELTGDPATLRMTNGMTLRNRVLMVDVLTHKFVIPSGYHIGGPTNTTGNTNSLMLPKLPRAR